MKITVFVPAMNLKKKVTTLSRILKCLFQIYFHSTFSIIWAFKRAEIIIKLLSLEIMCSNCLHLYTSLLLSLLELFSFKAAVCVLPS